LKGHKSINTDVNDEESTLLTNPTCDDTLTDNDDFSEEIENKMEIMQVVTDLFDVLYQNLKTKSFIFDHSWDVPDCYKNRNYLFVYSDNDQEMGSDDQAVIRECTNAFGIPTRKLLYPIYNRRVKSFYTDDEYDLNRRKFTDCMRSIIIASHNYDKVVFPIEGFGKGVSYLETKAPKSLKYLNIMLSECFGIVYP
jgi:hypothetical protein